MFLWGFAWALGDVSLGIFLGARRCFSENEDLSSPPLPLVFHFIKLLAPYSLQITDFLIAHSKFSIYE
jgi:hypothetical protein